MSFRDHPVSHLSLLCFVTVKQQKPSWNVYKNVSISCDNSCVKRSVTSGVKSSNDCLRRHEQSRTVTFTLAQQLVL